MKRIFTAFCTALFALCSCTPAEDTPEYRIVGYYPSFNPRADPDSICWDVTHVNLSFARINADGSIKDAQIRQSYPVAASHCRPAGIRMLVSLGGGGPKEEQDAFAAAVTDSTAREAVICNVMALVDDLGLDGVDIDYEAWSYPEDYRAAITDGLERLFLGFRERLGSERLLTAALSIWGLEHGGYSPKVIQSMDYMTIMSYDLTGWTDIVGPHSPMSFFIEGIEAALACGAEPSRIVPGVPFYGRGWEDRDLDRMYGLYFSDIVKRYPGAEFGNEIAGSDGEAEFWYDGFPAMDAKVDYIKKHGLGGIMFWEMTLDSLEPEKNLLRHINARFRAD